MITTGQIPTSSWRKSSYSGNNGGECVEVADTVAKVLPVRDSKIPSGPVLAFPTPAWSSFIATLKSGNSPS
ncbi:DUF397 domain-containing protein [Streptomyces sodiiphilus]|uniref:DUF397 domain-containing protein n=1 Tax=Streptomyces sodiiphilus TaxID=226217 RepID=A0ABN2P145_9ACTN